MNTYKTKHLRDLEKAQAHYNLSKLYADAKVSETHDDSPIKRLPIPNVPELPIPDCVAPCIDMSPFTKLIEDTIDKKLDTLFAVIQNQTGHIEDRLAMIAPRLGDINAVIEDNLRRFNSVINQTKGDAQLLSILRQKLDTLEKKLAVIDTKLNTIVLSLTRRHC